jgi:hypothetical protein
MAKRTNRMAWGLVIGLAMFCSLGAGQKIDLTSSKPLRLGCERAGVNLYQVDTMPLALPSEAGQRIAVSYGEQTQLVRELNQLRGLLRIDSGEAALRFVRLRTSPATWHMWPDGPSEVEIVAASRAPNLPNYGLSGFGSWIVKHWRKSSSGLHGILSHEVCRAIGFGPPSVHRESGGFTIERWTYAERGRRWTQSIQKVREHVGEDGEYRRTTVATINWDHVRQLSIGRYE